MPKITKATVDAHISQGERPAYLWDSSLAGFGVKALPSGKKQYVLKYRVGGGGRTASQRWETLGAHGQITCEEARTKAKKALGQVAHGIDPQKAKDDARSSQTLGDAWVRLTESWPVSNKQTAKQTVNPNDSDLTKTQKEYMRQWTNLIAPRLSKLPVRSIGSDHVERLRMSLLHTPYQANRVVALVSRAMSLCETWGWRDRNSNPCRDIDKFKEQSRERYLNDDELIRVGAAMDELVAMQGLSKGARNALRLLLLTGARLNEILEAKVSAIDKSRRVIHLAHSKSGKRDIFLSQTALAVIEDQLEGRGGVDGDQLFPGPGKGGALVNLRKPWTRVCDHAGLQGVRLHDLRHTAASVAVKEGASLPIIGRVLGHTQAQTTKRYAHVANEAALAAVDQISEAMSTALNLRH